MITSRPRFRLEGNTRLIYRLDGTHSRRVEPPYTNSAFVARLINPCSQPSSSSCRCNSQPINPFATTQPRRRSQDNKLPYLPALLLLYHPGTYYGQRLNPTCSTEISFPAHHHHHSSPVINGRQGWAVRVPAPELSISSSTPMQVGPISSRAPDARHAILTYASCCAATRHLRHATPSFPPQFPRVIFNNGAIHYPAQAAGERHVQKNNSRASGPRVAELSITNTTVGAHPLFSTHGGHLNHKKGK